jgi:hypothetical protein
MLRIHGLRIVAFLLGRVDGRLARPEVVTAALAVGLARILRSVDVHGGQKSWSTRSDKGLARACKVHACTAQSYVGEPRRQLT